MELSVVVPARNEARRLAVTIPRILAYLDARPGTCEVIVVDDGSSDDTALLVEGLARPGLVLARHDRTRGKGAAVKTGIALTRGAWVLLTDADLSTPIEELERLEAHVETHPVVVGSRAVAGARVDPRQPFSRELLGKSYNLVLRALRLTELHDTQCGFKLLRGDIARKVAPQLEISGFAYDAELLWLCTSLGTSIKEVAVRWAHSAPSSVRIPVEPLRMLRDTVRLRLRVTKAAKA